MAMNFTTLTGAATVTGSIQYWINYSRIDSAGILEEAQAWIYQRLRVVDMIKTDNVSLALSASTAALPADYLDPLHLGIPGRIPRIRLKDVEFFKATLGFDTAAALPVGLPTYWCRTDDLIQLNTKMDQAYTAKLTYFSRPAALSADIQTNWLTTKHPTLLRRVCTMFAAEARKEHATMDRNEVRALQDIKEIKVESDLAMRGMELDFNWDEN